MITTFNIIKTGDFQSEINFRYDNIITYFIKHKLRTREILQLEDDENKLFLEHLKKCDSFVEKHKITIQEFKNKLLIDLNDEV